MTWHYIGLLAALTIGLLAALTGQTLQRCFQSLECCEYSPQTCRSPSPQLEHARRLLWAPVQITILNSSEKFDRQNQLKFGQFAISTFHHRLDTDRVKKWEGESEKVWSWEPNAGAAWAVSISSKTFFFLHKHHPVISATLVSKSPNTAILAFQVYYWWLLFISSLLDWSDVSAVIRDKVERRRLLTKAG